MEQAESILEQCKLEMSRQAVVLLCRKRQLLPDCLPPPCHSLSLSLTTPPPLSPHFNLLQLPPVKSRMYKQSLVVELIGNGTFSRGNQIIPRKRQPFSEGYIFGKTNMIILRRSYCYYFILYSPWLTNILLKYCYSGLIVCLS